MQSYNQNRVVKERIYKTSQDRSYLYLNDGDNELVNLDEFVGSNNSHNYKSIFFTFIIRMNNEVAWFIDDIKQVIFIDDI